MLTHVDVLLPAHIARTPVRLSQQQLRECASAESAIAALDATSAGVLEPLSLLLLRTESIASSKIERVDASTRDYARALHGIRSNTSATSMVGVRRQAASGAELGWWQRLLAAQCLVGAAAAGVRPGVRG